MIYNNKYIFVHVPKTAGLSVSASLGGKDKKIPTHTPLRCVEKGDRFAFGFIRNPWARMVSLHRFLCQKTFRNTDNFDQEAVREMGFKTWLMDDAFIMTEDYQTEGEPWVMRTHWRTSNDGSLAPMQRRPQMWWLDGCDYIGKVEDLPLSYSLALHRAGIKAQELPHINQTKGKPWRNEYDEDTKKFVEEHFADDIEFGGYTFE